MKQTSGVQKKALFLVAGFFSALVTAAPVCTTTQFSFQQGNIVLTPPLSAVGTIYIFYNRSNRAFFLDHPVARPSASAGWGSELQPQHYSAILMNQSPFTLTCTALSKMGPGQALNCREVVKVCRLQSATITLKSLPGSYWLVENVTRRALYAGIQKRGFALTRS